MSRAFEIGEDSLAQAEGLIAQFKTGLEET
jgi:hypothetical protein